MGHVLNRVLACILAFLVAVGGTSHADAQNLSTYGTPGLIDMPTAEVLPDGSLGFTASGFGPTLRTTMVFQMLPGVYGTFRYAYLEDFFANSRPTNPSLYDRSFDIHFQLRNESVHWPAVAIGLRDVAGSGIYAGEYVVATKTFKDRVAVTGGVG